MGKHTLSKYHTLIPTSTETLGPANSIQDLEDERVVTLQLKKLGNLYCYLDIFHLIGVFIRRGPEPNSVAVGTA